MKRVLSLLFAAVAALSLAGCGQEKGTSAYSAKNEIVTYERIDPEKTQILVSRTGNIPVEAICEAFEEKNPDVQIVYIDITGGNSGYKPLFDWVTRGYAPDVVFAASDFFDVDSTAQYFKNFSLDPVLQNYEAAALKRTAVDNDVYLLPGPANVTAMIYNKTLFDQYGWELPESFDAFVTLCDQIRADTDGEVEPWNPNAKYSDELAIALQAFTYEELFGGVENRTWYNDFVSGNATFAGHMEPYMAAIQKLVDHNILREEHFTYSATTRGKEFAAGKIAMINMSIYDANSDEYQFGYMPFPGTKGSLGYVCDKYNCFVGIPIKEHTEEETGAIDRLVAFFSSEEGQLSYIGRSMMISNVKGVPLNQENGLDALEPAIGAGHLFALLDFGSTTGKRCNFSLHQSALDITTGAVNGAECIAAVDAAPYVEPETAAEPQEVLATVSEDMTVLETSLYIADMYRAATGAQIGLVAHNEAYRGNLMRFFSGDVTAAMVSVFKPRSFANDSALVKVSMTGQQILDALNNPPGYDLGANCVYACSGLTCEVVPWAPQGERYRSVKLTDGKKLDPEQTYTVGIWAGTVLDAYITETVETYAGTWEEHMTAKLRADGTVAAAKDDRIRLIWE